MYIQGSLVVTKQLLEEKLVRTLLKIQVLDPILISHRRHVKLCCSKLHPREGEHGPSRTTAVIEESSANYLFSSPTPCNLFSSPTPCNLFSSPTPASTCTYTAVSASVLYLVMFCIHTSLTCNHVIIGFT